jgi:topoisomerase-4 subunit A
VQLGQKDILIEAQGNWGNILTGDSAAAPRYIEARLSAFALEVVFNPKITRWKKSYDGRKNEPVALPVKFPLLLAQGVEGIAVGLASKILPHNFVELLDAAVALLKDEAFTLYPDFPTGGYVEVSKYNDGLRGGKVRVRAKIQQLDKKTLVVKEIPFSTTTGSLIDSILAANDKGKIKIRKIDDNTAENVEILIHLAPGVSPDQTMDALYAFTDCEISLSPNNCVIHDGKPRFLGSTELLGMSVDHTVDLLAQELNLRLHELDEQWHFASLERIFIEKRIYRRIEKSETWEAVIQAIESGLEPHTKNLRREVTRDDIVRLTEIRIKRISKYDADRALDVLRKLEDEMESVKHHLAHLTEYAIAWFTNLKTKYGKGRERKTEIRNFENIEATMVAAANQKLYVNREEGFAGTALKKDEFVCDCSDIDDIIAFRADGSVMVTKVAAKVFLGTDIIHIDVFRKNDDRTIYNMVYQDGRAGKAMVKRFAVTSVTRDKEYDLTSGTKGSKILYFSANPNGEAELIHVMLRPRPRMKKTSFDFDFAEIPIRGRASKGNTLSRYAVRKISKKEEGVSTLGAMGVWYDETVNRINTEERGLYLGEFKGEDKIIGFNRSGTYRTYGFDSTTHFQEDMFLIQKYDPAQVVSLVYYDGNTGDHYHKRFVPELTEKRVLLTNEHPETKIIHLSLDPDTVFFVRGRKRTKSAEETSEEIRAMDHIAVKGTTAKGKKLVTFDVEEVVLKEGQGEEQGQGEEEVKEGRGGVEQEQEQEQEEVKGGRGGVALRQAQGQEEFDPSTALRLRSGQALRVKEEEEVKGEQEGVKKEKNTKKDPPSQMTLF